LNPGLAPQSPEQSGLGFAEYDELGVVLGYAEQVEGDLFGFR
jgi:hypothetical protein